MQAFGEEYVEDKGKKTNKYRNRRQLIIVNRFNIAVCSTIAISIGNQEKRTVPFLI
jgi:hypothetical protein